MPYDFETYFNHPSTYLRARQYPSYYYSYNKPSYGSYLHDRYYNLNGYYSPRGLYYYGSPYLSYIPYHYKYDIRDIPDYTYRHYATYPMSKRPTYSEAEKYAYTYGLDFSSTAKEIRDSTIQLLHDAHRRVPRAGSVPRFLRASSMAPAFSIDHDYYKSKRANSRARMMSEEPSFYRSQPAAPTCTSVEE